VGNCAKTSKLNKRFWLSLPHFYSRHSGASNQAHLQNQISIASAVSQCKKRSPPVAPQDAILHPTKSELTFKNQQASRINGSPFGLHKPVNPRVRMLRWTDHSTLAKLKHRS
jgi:hypothetical protein